MASDFTHAIVRRPSRSVIDGLTGSPELGKPDYDLAIEQHDQYVEALKACGVEVTVLPALEGFPDSVFVEDTCVITPKGVVMDQPAVEARAGEAKEMLPTIRQFFPDERIRRITAPGTLEGGDVMMVDDHCYVGRSARTNDEGFRQFAAFLAEWSMTTEQVPVEHILHLKTGGTYVENGNLLVSGELKRQPAYRRGQFKHIFEVPDEEAYGADCVNINGKIIMAAGYPAVQRQLEDWGYEIITVEMSEYRKIDGSITCLSLRW
jgi:dimethylargininase